MSPQGGTQAALARLGTRAGSVKSKASPRWCQASGPRLVNRFVNALRRTRRYETSRLWSVQAFTVIDLVEILEHWYSGRAKLLVAESLGIDRKTVRKYVARRKRPGSSRAARR